MRRLISYQWFHIVSKIFRCCSWKGSYLYQFISSDFILVNVFDNAITCYDNWLFRLIFPSFLREWNWIFSCDLVCGTSFSSDIIESFVSQFKSSKRLFSGMLFVLSFVCVCVCVWGGGGGGAVLFSSVWFLLKKSVVWDIDLLSSHMVENACSSISFLSLILRSSFFNLSFSNRKSWNESFNCIFSVLPNSIVVCKIPFSVLSLPISSAVSFKYFSLICDIQCHK